jgi:hypothetical protein
LLVVAYIFELSYESVVMTFLFRDMVLMRNITEPILYAAKLSIELFVLNRLRSVSKLNSEILQRGNISAVLTEDQCVNAQVPGEKQVDRAMMADPPAPPSGLGINLSGPPFVRCWRHCQYENNGAIRAYEVHDHTLSSRLMHGTAQVPLDECSLDGDLDELERQYLGRSSMRR